jgi:hypothetical protein
MGFAEPKPSRESLVVSYTTVSTLPALSCERKAVYFLLHFPSASCLQNGRVTIMWFTRRPAVSWHLALRCPDFPHKSCARVNERSARPRPFPSLECNRCDRTRQLTSRKNPCTLNPCEFTLSDLNGAALPALNVPSLVRLNKIKFF